MAGNRAAGVARDLQQDHRRCAAEAACDCNSHLSHVIAHIPDAKLPVPYVVESDTPVTLEFLVTDYAVHLRHHRAQAGVV